MTIPDADVLVHAGDISLRGRRKEIEAFNEWLGTLPHKYKIVISGNHDFEFEDNKNAREIMTNAIYLQDESVVIEGIKFYGSPW